MNKQRAFRPQESAKVAPKPLLPNPFDLNRPAPGLDGLNAMRYMHLHEARSALHRSLLAHGLIAAGIISGLAPIAYMFHEVWALVAIPALAMAHFMRKHEKHKIEDRELSWFELVDGSNLDTYQAIARLVDEQRAGLSKPLVAYIRSMRLMARSVPTRGEYQLIFDEYHEYEKAWRMAKERQSMRRLTNEITADSREKAAA